MKTTRALRLATILSFVFTAGLLSSVSGVLAQSPVRVYEDRQFRFAITPPPDWSAQQSAPSKIEAVVTFSGTGGTLTVAARPARDYHRKVIGRITQHNLSEEQLADLAHNLYDNAPGVLEPKLAITSLSNHRALASFYAYEFRSLGAVMYVLLCKAETIRGDTFYKVEVTGPAAETLEEASRLFIESSDLLLNHMRTFVFLPGKQ